MLQVSSSFTGESWNASGRGGSTQPTPNFGWASFLFSKATSAAQTITGDCCSFFFRATYSP